jgi:hypothetical protein
MNSSILPASCRQAARSLPLLFYADARLFPHVLSDGYSTDHEHACDGVGVVWFSGVYRRRAAGKQRVSRLLLEECFRMRP